MTIDLSLSLRDFVSQRSSHTPSDLSCASPPSRIFISRKRLSMRTRLTERTTRAITARLEIASCRRACRHMKSVSDERRPFRSIDPLADGCILLGSLCLRMQWNLGPDPSPRRSMQILQIGCKLCRIFKLRDSAKGGKLDLVWMHPKSYPAI